MTEAQIENSLGWEFTHEYLGAGSTMTYAFSPATADGSAYDFKIFVRAGGGFDRRNNIEKSETTKSVGAGIAMSKALFDSWDKERQPEYRYRLNHPTEPTGESESAPTFQELIAMILLSLTLPYEQGEWVDIDPRGVTVEFERSGRRSGAQGMADSIYIKDTEGNTIELRRY